MNKWMGVYTHCRHENAWIKNSKIEGLINKWLNECMDKDDEEAETWLKTWNTGYIISI
jgi:hypothetical protein